jgi:hypothetical protein
MELRAHSLAIAVVLAALGGARAQPLLWPTSQILIGGDDYPSGNVG